MAYHRQPGLAAYNAQLAKMAMAAMANGQLAGGARVMALVSARQRMALA
jgi:hypothetical protein